MLADLPPFMILKGLTARTELNLGFEGVCNDVPTYGLPNGIHVVCDLEFWHVLEELLGQLLGGKAHGSDVVGPQGEGLCRGLHDLQGGPEAVVDVHHWEPGAGLQVALKLAVLHCIVENLDRIVWKRILPVGLF